MRAARPVLVLAGVAAFGILLTATRQAGSRAQGRRKGLEAAERDLARGTPRIKRLLGTFDDIGSDGVGLDQETGLPLSNTLLMCGTGVDFVAYGASIEAYNERILGAYGKGELRELTLGHKLRTPKAIRSLFEGNRSVRLATDGDRIEIAAGEIVVTYHHEVFPDGSEGNDVMLTRRGCEPERLRLFYPAPFDHRPGTLWVTGARGPFDVLVVDEGTTAILRDGEGFAWIVSLPGGLVLQVVARTP